MMKPSIGRIVHYVIPSGPHKGDHRAAIITAVYGEGHVNLTIFADEEGDCTHERFADNYLLRGCAICQGNPDEHGTWHWPEERPLHHTEAKFASGGGAP